MPGDAHVLTSESRPELLDGVHALLERLWEQHADVAAADRMALTTAVAEVAANVLEHAAPGRVVPVRLEVRVDGAALVAVLEDEGVPFPGGDAAGGGDPLAETGRGLSMTRALCDDVQYVRDGAVNRWHLVRARRG